MRTSDECGGPQGSGADNASEHDVQVAGRAGAAEALRRVQHYFDDVNNLDARLTVQSVAAHIAEEMGVTL